MPFCLTFVRLMGSLSNIGAVECQLKSSYPLYEKLTIGAC